MSTDTQEAASLPALSDQVRKTLYPKNLGPALGWQPGASGNLPALPVSAAAWTAWAMQQRAGGLLVLVTDGPRTLERMLHHLETLLPPRHPEILCYPGWENLPGQGSVNLDIAGDRLQTLRRLENKPAGILITDVQALMQKTVTRTRFQENLLTVQVGQTLEFDAFVLRLEAMGYVFSPEVLNKGEAVKRGGLVDVWPPTLESPVRLEFFGDEVESIRFFDPNTQRSSDPCARVEICPATETLSPEEVRAPDGSFFDFLPDDVTWYWFEEDAVVQHADVYFDSLCELECADFVLPPSEVFRRAAQSRGGGEVRTGPVHGEHLHEPEIELKLQAVLGVPSIPREAGKADLLENERLRFVGELFQRAEQGSQVILVFGTPGGAARFAELSSGVGKPPPKKLATCLGVLEEGFEIPAAGLVVVSESEIYGLRKKQRGKYETRRRDLADVETGTRYHDFSEMVAGELVVHLDHGIGRFQGLKSIEFNGRMQEVISVEYAEGGRLHLPVSQAHLLSRYVGLGAGSPKLHTLGGKRWNKEKEAAGAAVEDMAAQLIETQAVRRTLQGHAFPPDTLWQKEFEATFPWQETEDQEHAIQDVKADMESTTPMDRLICGDVGYGKTEVAMRAAFKAVMDGRQVAVLVPTTILAQQHYESFRERMAAFPVVVEVLSRFKTRGEQLEILGRLRAGAVDIVVGTHRLVQGDVQFKNLGLVVIDEEQRFGVKHKEKLKRLKKLVDVLTLSATPIPRTLYMSLTGARDMSTIQTAPRERHPILTTVRAFDEELIRKAVLRELNREGQVFFLHNRVQSIRMMERLLREWVPEARILVGHGQMPEKELEDTMHRFVEGEADILLCTTIIESGVDIPNVNTIIIDRADRFGLAELYQLRGRVGRYKNQAYAFLLTPREGGMSHDARKRMLAIQRYSSLGAGFKLALRDLEIRGAGNLLGAQQSGHITSVGFDLYCRLLDRTVQRMKEEEPTESPECQVLLDFIHFDAQAEDPAACAIPLRYVEDESLRLQAYRTIAGAQKAGEIEALSRDLTDRFGRLPLPVRNLLLLAQIRIAASAKGIHQVDVRGEKVLLSRGSGYLMVENRHPRLSLSRPPPERLEMLLNLVSHISAPS